MVFFMNLKKDNRGFTLVELIIAIAILGIVMTAVYQLFISVNRYNDSITVMNDYQNITRELVYRLRVELSNASDGEAIDPASIPDADTDDLQYMYIVSDDTIGGITVYDVDASNNRTITTYGSISSLKNYKTRASFKTTGAGAIELSVSIERQDITDAGGNKVEPYVQSTSIICRSTKTSDVQRAIRFKRI